MAVCWQFGCTYVESCQRSPQCWRACCFRLNFAIMPATLLIQLVLREEALLLVRSCLRRCFTCIYSVISPWRTDLIRLLNHTYSPYALSPDLDPFDTCGHPVWKAFGLVLNEMNCWKCVAIWPSQVIRPQAGSGRKQAHLSRKTIYSTIGRRATFPPIQRVIELISPLFTISQTYLNLPTITLVYKRLDSFILIDYKPRALLLSEIRLVRDSLLLVYLIYQRQRII